MKCCVPQLPLSRKQSIPVEQLERRIVRKMGQAIGDHSLIEQGDRILVAVSGGKDSYTMLHGLELLRRRAPVSFSLLALNVHHGFAGYRADRIEEHLSAEGFEHRMVRAEISAVMEKVLRPDETRCSLCARLRRGVLYTQALALGCNKIALGHHKDDLIETLLLNLFFTGQLKSMPPWLRSDDGKNIVIRPLAYVDEPDIVQYARMKKFPVVCCACPACGTLDNLQRREIKKLLTGLESAHPGLKSSILKSMRQVVPTHLLDRSLMNRTDTLDRTSTEPTPDAHHQPLAGEEQVRRC